jgi:hypothetical protein
MQSQGPLNRSTSLRLLAFRALANTGFFITDFKWSWGFVTGGVNR